MKTALANSGERNTVCLLITSSLFFYFLHSWKQIAGLVLRLTEAKKKKTPLSGHLGEGAPGEPESGKVLDAQGRQKLLSASCSWVAAWKIPVSMTTSPASQDWTLPLRFHPLKIKLTRSSYRIQTR